MNKNNTFPNGWGVTDGDFASYTKKGKTLKILRYKHGYKIRITPFYRYALDRYDRKCISPFNHNNSGTIEYREIKLWRFGLGIGLHFTLHKRIIESWNQLKKAVHM